MADPRRRPEIAGDTGRRLRVGFVMEQVLGHVTVYRNLRSGVERLDEADVRWVETEMFDSRGYLERLPGVPGFVRASARALIDLRRGLRGWQPDVLVFNTQKAAAFCQWQMLRTPSILMTDVTPIQLDAMADHYDHAVDKLPGLASLKHQTNMLNFRLARAIAPTSTWTRDSLIRDYNVAPEKVHVNPVGVDTTYWRPDEKRRAGGRVQLLFVGGHFERKGGKLLLDVFRQLNLADRADLHIVTRDAVEPEPGVVVHGAIPYDSPAFLRAYQQADVFVLPTLADCFTNVSLEATAVGLPIVASRMGGLPDIVEHGSNGYLVPPADGRRLAEALVRIVDSPHTRAAFSATARERARARFDARANAARLLDVAWDVWAAWHGRSTAMPGARDLSALPNLNPAFNPPRLEPPIVQMAAAGAPATTHQHAGGSTDGAAS